MSIENEVEKSLSFGSSRRTPLSLPPSLRSRTPAAAMTPPARFQAGLFGAGGAVGRSSGAVPALCAVGVTEPGDGGDCSTVLTGLWAEGLGPVADSSPTGA